MNVYIFPQYPITGDSWSLVLAYLGGKPIYRRNHYGIIT